MTAMTLPSKNGSKPHIDVSPWQNATVRSFFEAFNWDDTPPAPTPSLGSDTATPTAGAPATLPLDAMTVAQFFNAVNWEGREIAAAPAPTNAQPPAPPPDKSMTLDDFSGLF